MAPRPMLGELELEKVQHIIVDGDQVLVEQGIPALEGDFIQRLGRRARQINLQGFLAGSTVLDSLKQLREKLRAAEPVSFVTDIASATQVNQVLIEQMGVREMAGKPERFEYAFLLREFIPAPATATETPPPVVVPPVTALTGTLIVNVIVESEPGFDFSLVTVTVEGARQDGEAFDRRQLTNRSDNRWTEREFPAGDYTVQASTEQPSMTGTANAEVRSGQEEEVTIILHPDQQTSVAKAFIIHFQFDKAFVEPCLRQVLAKVIQYADSHSDEMLVIVGHTDESGSNEYNQSLSERRSRAVYAFLTFGLDASHRAEALLEWDNLRRAGSGVTRLSDNWGTREYQYMLQDLGYYPATINGIHDSATDEAVRSFQSDQGLTIDGDVGDQTWPLLIEKYLDQSQFAMAEDRFLENAKDACDSGSLKWLGCGERMPVSSTPRDCSSPAWRPNRRTEILFVKVDTLPCDLPQPVTFNLPSPGSVNSDWCLGPGDANSPCCFLTHDPQQRDKLLVQPAEPNTVIIKGSIKLEDGTPLAGVHYVLIAPDGEFMDGEKTCTPTKGLPIEGKTAADGSFSYPNKPKGMGIFSIEIKLVPPQIARLAEDPPVASKGTFVCKDMDGSSDLDIIVSSQTIMVSNLELVNANDIDTPIESATEGDGLRVRADVRHFSGNEITIELISQFDPIPPVQQPTSSLAFVVSDDIENELDALSAGDSFRLRADLTDVTEDSIIVELMRRD